MTGSRSRTILTSITVALLTGLTVAACGGGGGATQSSPSPSSGRGENPAPPARSGGRPAIVGVGRSGLGRILVDSQGRTLYLFKADSATASACDGACATAWPPLLAHGNPSVAGGLNPSLVSTIHRPGGGRQLSYNGHPLYLFVDDQKPGDVKGQGVTAFGALWYALSRDGNQVSGPASA
jgi:predicted lipoprotein with Yx(FWY)xxD motif